MAWTIPGARLMACLRRSNRHAFGLNGRYPADDLSWYANIPVPTSYMITATADDFFGGYDHAAEAGVVHVANHHIAPGKKQWTWGNHEFGYNWDRCLTDDDGPYIELMAGVYTDNQPDFSFLAPGETKSFSQFWYPIRKIGVPQAANLQAAMSLRIDREVAYVGVCVTEDISEARLILEANSQLIAEWTRAITVAEPLFVRVPLPGGISEAALSVTLEQNGHALLRYVPGEIVPAAAPEAATEPPAPAEIASNDELYLTGVHLQQYRHATRSPEPYWHEAVRRDPGDARANTALGTWCLKRGEFAMSEAHLRTAIARLTRRIRTRMMASLTINSGLLCVINADSKKRTLRSIRRAGTRRGVVRLTMLSPSLMRVKISGPRRSITLSEAFGAMPMT